MFPATHLSRATSTTFLPLTRLSQRSGKFLAAAMAGTLSAMRKKIASSIIAASLAVAAAPAGPPAVATPLSSVDSSSQGSSDSSEGANGSSDEAEGSGFKGFMNMLFEPYEQMSSDNLATSSMGAARAIINYVIIAAGVTLIGQAIQIAMSNMPR